MLYSFTKYFDKHAKHVNKTLLYMYLEHNKFQKSGKNMSNTVRQ